LKKDYVEKDAKATKKTRKTVFLVEDEDNDDADVEKQEKKAEVSGEDKQLEEERGRYVFSSNNNNNTNNFQNNNNNNNNIVLNHPLSLTIYQAVTKIQISLGTGNQSVSSSSNSEQNKGATASLTNGGSFPQPGNVNINIYHNYYSSASAANEVDQDFYQQIFSCLTRLPQGQRTLQDIKNLVINDKNFLVYRFIQENSLQVEKWIS